MIVGELTHDHEIVWNVTNGSLQDKLGMSDVIFVNICESIKTYACMHAHTHTHRQTDKHIHTITS